MDETNAGITWSGAIFSGRPELRLHVSQPSDTFLKLSSPFPPRDVRGAIIHDSRQSYLSSVLALELGLASTDGDAEHVAAMVWFVDAFYAQRYGGDSSYYLDHRFVLGQPETDVDVVLGDDVLRLGTYTEQGGGWNLQLPLIPVGNPHPAP